MRWWRWLWRRRKIQVRDPRPAGGNGHAAAQARETQQRKLRDAWRMWPEVRAAAAELDELARLAEQAMRRRR